MSLISFSLAVVCLIPTLVEAYLDRFGETQKGKVKDTLWLVIAAAGIVGLFWWLFDINPFKTALLLLAWRVLIFNQVVNWFLKKYSGNHNHINIWTYIGKTSTVDKIISKVNPWVRLFVRVGLFLIALYPFVVD